MNHIRILIIIDRHFPRDGKRSQLSCVCHKNIFVKGRLFFTITAKAIIWNLGFMIMPELMMIPIAVFFDKMPGEHTRLSATVFMMKLP